jgi:hypothetical protein
LSDIILNIIPATPMVLNFTTPSVIELTVVPPSVQSITVHESTTIVGATGVSDHGGLTGLGDNDHPQYSLTSHVHAHSSLTGLGADDHPQYSLTTHTHAVDDLSDVTITAATNGQVLTKYASGWRNETPTPAPVTSVTGTAGQVTVAPTTGAVVVSLPSSVTVGTLVATTLTVTASGDLSGSLQAPTVNKIRGINIQSGTPNDHDILAYHIGSSRWAHSTPAVLGISEIGHTHVMANITDLAAALALKQTADATLSGLSALAVAGANLMVYSTGVDTFATSSLTPFARTLLDDVDAATMRTTLGISASGHTHAAADVVSGNFDLARLGTSGATSAKFLRGSGAWDTIVAADTVGGTFATARLGSGTATSSTWLRGDGAWATVNNFDPCNPSSEVWQWDDMLPCSVESGEAGNLNWQISNGSLTSVAGELNHPGIARHRCSGTINQVSLLSPTSTVGGTQNQVVMSDVYEHTWVFKNSNSGSGDCYQILGFFENASSVTPNGVYVKLDLLGNWKFTTRQGGAETTVTGWTDDANWHNCKFVKSAGVWSFYHNGTLMGTSSTNLPTSTTIMTYGSASSPTAGSLVRRLDLDFFSSKYLGQTR